MSDKKAVYNTRNVLRGIKYHLTGRAVQSMASFAVMLITVRFMVVEEYAAYVTITAAGTTIGLFSMFGLDRVASRYIPDARINAHPEELSRFVARLRLFRLGTVVLLALGAIIAWPWAAPLFKLNSASMFWPVLVFALSHAMSQYSGVVMQSLMIQKGIRDATTAIWLSRLLVLVLFVILNPVLDALTAVWIAIGSEFIGVAWMAALTGVHMQKLVGEAQPRTSTVWPGSYREIARFAWQNYIMGQAAFTSQPRIQQLVAAVLLPPAAVAAFGFYRSLSDQVARLMPFNMFRSLIEPVMIGRYMESRDFAQMNNVISLVLKMNLMFAAPLAAWLWVAGKPMVGFITGGKFIEYNWVLALLLTTLVASNQKTMAVIMANTLDMSSHLLKATIFGSSLTVLVLWSHIAWTGMLALVLSDVIFAAVFNYTIFSIARIKGFDYKVDWIALARITVFAIFPAVMLWAVADYFSLEPGISESVISALVIYTAFFTANILYKPFSATERQMVLRISGRMPMPF